MALLLKILASAKSAWAFVKKLKGKTIAVSIAIIIVAFALWSRQIAIKKYDALKNEVAQAELKYDIEKAKADTIWLKAEHIIDTIWVSRVRIDTTAGVIDTFSVPCPEERGYVAIDTVCRYGSDANYLSIEIEGRAYYPKGNPNKSWLRVVPDLTALQPHSDVKIHDRAIGLGIMNSLNPNDFSATALAYGRWERLTIGMGYSSKKIYSVFLMYDGIRF